jgi:UDP:flavonoid glycosyltransferase YjiC (YdhE family)
MARIAMVTWDGGGNVPPLLHIGRELRERGNDVMVLGDEAQRERFEAAGLGFAGYRNAPPWSRTDPYDLASLFGRFLDGGTGQDLDELIDDWAPEAVVADCFMLAPLQAAQARGVPNVVLMHSLWAAFGEALPQSPITEMGAPYGREPRRLWEAASEVLVVTDRDLDPVRDEIPPNVRWTGVAQPAAKRARRGDGNRALLSLSTVWFPGQQESMQRVLDGLDGLPVEVTATIDRSISVEPLRVPDNVRLSGYVDHGEVMPNVSMVIGHGGHATTMYALAHDLPVLVVPQQPLADQVLIGEVLARHGAGLVVSQHPSVEEVRDAVMRIANDDSFTAAAARIGERLRSQDGVARATDRIQELVGARALR